jgi:NAD(P)-dependent dehydrogenase (short-subunit alcohol dehydrogenase family)
MTKVEFLKDKVAIITGGSRGIGFAVAHAFSTAQCNVVITGRDGQSLNEAAAKAARTGGQIVAHPCDVTDPAQVQELFGAVEKRFSKIDILVNNAGIAHALTPVATLPLEQWKKVIDTNLTGMFLCTRAALPLMHAGSTIVNNLSVAAIQPFEGMAAYNASKYGALGFTNALREELRKSGIRVLALLPGATDTSIWDQFWPEAPHEKMISADTVAEAILHVVSLPAKTTIEEIRLRPTVGTL